MKGFFHRIILPMVLIFFLFTFLTAVCLVNFSKRPEFYNADMYLDVLYACEAWEHGSLFPDGWVFGNQFYVVSTPILAALLQSVLNPLNAMAMASTLISVSMILSFFWMLKPVMKSGESCLAGVVFYMAIVLYCGDAHRSDNGWQLLFTMCSYYGAYAITAFLAFGCYLRADGEWSRSLKILFLIACMLSFGTGMQSLRQTAVMTCPLICTEFLRCLYGVLRKKSLNFKPTIVVSVLSIFNIVGLIVIRLLEIPQRQMNMNTEFWGISGMIAAIPKSLLSAFSLFGVGGKVMLFVFWAMMAVCGVAGARIVFCTWRQRGEKDLYLLLLFALGVAAVFAVSVLGILRVRSIYYFMLYPMVSFLMAYLYDNFGNHGKHLVILFLIVMLCFSWPEYWEDVLEPVFNRDCSMNEVADYLERNGYTVLYSEWDNAGEDVAIASGGRIKAGYWSWEYAPFESIRYLCDPGIYSEDPANCVYLFRGEERALLGCEVAEQRGTELELLRYFEESDLYVYTAQINLMSA